MKDNIKKHIETTVETAVLLALVASGVALVALVLGYTDLLRQPTVRAGLQWLALADILYVAYKIYKLKLNQK